MPSPPSRGARRRARQAHVLKDFGPYSVALGWVHEPTYVGQLNAVQVVVKDASGKPVADIGDGDLKVVVSVGGQDSAALDLVTKYDEDTGLGMPGDYEAPLVPTVPGDYTFHLAGQDPRHRRRRDGHVERFDLRLRRRRTDIQFPAKLPSLTESRPGSTGSTPGSRRGVGGAGRRRAARRPTRRRSTRRHRGELRSPRHAGPRFGFDRARRRRCASVGSA